MGRRDAATKRYNGQWSARPFRCPDGTMRHAWLQNGIWALFDYLADTKKIDVPWLIERCWEDTRGQEDADYQFMAHLEYRINTLYEQRVVMPETGVANDNWFLHEEDRLIAAAAARLYIFGEEEG